MNKAIAWAACALLALLVAQVPAEARRVPARFDAVQVRKGLAAFDRRDYAAAGLLLHAPAERGNASAQAVLCFLYAYGRGVPQSFPVAAFWCHRAAGQGNPQGQYLLGLLYSSGHGVPENYVQAYKWLNLAATQASGAKRDFSYRLRDSVAAKMSPRQVAKAQALTIAWRPMPEVYGAPLPLGACAGEEPCLDR